MLMGLRTDIFHGVGQLLICNSKIIKSKNMFQDRGSVHLKTYDFSHGSWTRYFPVVNEISVLTEKSVF